MGCGACKASKKTAEDPKADAPASAETTKGEAAGDAGVVAQAPVVGGAIGGAALGAALAGPAAPVGAIIGGLVGAALGAATKGTVGKVVEQAGAMRDELWKILANRPEILAQLPPVGLLQMPCIEADLGRRAAMMPGTNSYLYTIQATELDASVCEVIEGTSVFEVIEGKGELNDSQLESLQASVKLLEEKKVCAIVGERSKMLFYRETISKMTTLPVLLTPLLQAPLLVSALAADEQVVVLTKDENVMDKAIFAKLLGMCGLGDAYVDKFIIVSCNELAELRQDIAQEDSDEDKIEKVKALQDALVKLTQEAFGKAPKAKALLLEVQLPLPFSDALRKAVHVPVFDTLTLVHFVFKGKTDNPRFGIDFQSSQDLTLRLEKEHMPEIGIMRIDYTYPPAMGDAAHPNSYYYQTHHAVVEGLTFEAAQAGEPLTDEQREKMKGAIQTLESRPNLMGIAGDCGFLINYQKDAVDISKRVPCFISALLQCSVLKGLFGSDACFLILTANGPALEPGIGPILSQCHVRPEDHGRFAVLGCQDLPGFDAVFKAEKVNVEEVQPHVVKLVEDYKAANPNLAAVLLECTELPPYADAIRHATGLLVLDVITLVDFFHDALSEDPYFGIDWDALAGVAADTGAGAES